MHLYVHACACLRVYISFEDCLLSSYLSKNTLDTLPDFASASDPWELATVWLFPPIIAGWENHKTMSTTSSRSGHLISEPLESAICVSHPFDCIFHLNLTKNTYIHTSSSVKAEAQLGLNVMWPRKKHGSMNSTLNYQTLFTLFFMCGTVVYYIKMPSIKL